jgi:protein TonB
MAQPRYPLEARRLKKEGVVVLKLSLDETGAVFDVLVMQSAGFGMDEASREAVLLSRFRPATSKGRPVACLAILPIHFKLR